MPEWSFLTNHARVLLCVAHDPGARLRDIAASLGITERTAHGILTDLAEAGYVVKQKDGRRNRYQIEAHLPLREPASREPAIGEVLAVLLGTKDGQAGPAWLPRTGSAAARRTARMSSPPGPVVPVSPAAQGMATGPAPVRPGATFFPAAMIAPGLLARCEGVNDRSRRPASLPGWQRQSRVQDTWQLIPQYRQVSGTLLPGPRAEAAGSGQGGSQWFPLSAPGTHGCGSRRRSPQRPAVRGRVAPARDRLRRRRAARRAGTSGLRVHLPGR